MGTGRHPGCGAAHRPVSGASRRVWLCAAEPGAGQRSDPAEPAQPCAGLHGAVDAGHAADRAQRQCHRDEAGGQRVDAAIAADDLDCPQSDQHPAPRHHLRLWPLRTELGTHARPGGYRLHRAGPGSGPGAPGGRGGQLGGLWRRCARAVFNGRWPGASQRCGGDISGHAGRAQSVGQRARTRAQRACGGAHGRRPRS